MVDLAVDQRCNSACIMCTTVRPADNKNVNQHTPSFDEVCDIIHNTPKDEKYFSITGGEPTLRKDLPQIIKFIRNTHPNTEIKLLTNGRKFCLGNYVEKITKSDVNYYIIPIHAHAPELHDFITRTPQSFDQTIRGIKNLLKLDKNVEIRVVIHGVNYPFLGELSGLIVRTFPKVSRVVFLYFDAIGSGSLNKKRLFVKMSKVIPHLEKSVGNLTNNGIETHIYHIPHCTINKKYWNLIPGKTVESRRIMFKEECKNCKFKDGCPGIWKTYAKWIGTDEFKVIK